MKENPLDDDKGGDMADKMTIHGKALALFPVLFVVLTPQIMANGIKNISGTITTKIET